MLSELPKLFDRNFAIGFFLPAAFVASGVVFVLGSYELVVDLTQIAEELGTVSGAVLAGFAVWLVAIALVALNYQILRIFEGYPLFYFVEGLGQRRNALHTRCLRLVRRRFKQHRKRALALQRRIDALRASLRLYLSVRFRRRFRQHARAAFKLQAAVEAARAAGQPDPWTPNDHARRLHRAVETFPAEPAHVLPTRFGNLFRAFELYPSILYGLDAIPAWPRLQAVMPEHARKMLADSKAQLDFCVNLALAGFLAAVLHLGLALWCWRLPAPWLLLGGAVIALTGYQMALGVAAQFGSYVKAAFDLYRSELAKALGLEMPRSREAERAMWRTVSRMMIYRSAARAGELTSYRPHREEEG